MPEPVVLMEFDSRIEAEIFREMLEASGIEATISSDDCGTTLPALQLIRGTKLWVASDQLEDAQRLVSETADSAPADADGDADSGGDDRGERGEHEAQE